MRISAEKDSSLEGVMRGIAVRLYSLGREGRIGSETLDEISRYVETVSEYRGRGAHRTEVRVNRIREGVKLDPSEIEKILRTVPTGMDKVLDELRGDLNLSEREMLLEPKAEFPDAFSNEEILPNQDAIRIRKVKHINNSLSQIFAAEKKEVFGEGVFGWARDLPKRGDSTVLKAFLNLFKSNETDGVAFCIEAIKWGVENSSPLGTRNLAVLTSTAREDGISIGIVNLSIVDFIELQSALAASKTKEYIKSEEFLRTPKEERLPLLVRKILDDGLPLSSNNLGHIYSSLPKDVRELVGKVALPLKAFKEIEDALRSEGVKEYLGSEEFLGAPKEERLPLLVRKILDDGLPLSSENLGQIYSSLPKDVRELVGYIDLPLKAYEEFTSSLRESRIQAMLESALCRSLRPKQRFEFLIQCLKDLRLIPIPSNLHGLRSALPHKVSESLKSTDFGWPTYDTPNADS